MKKTSNPEFDAPNGLFRYCNDGSLTNNHGTICTDYSFFEVRDIACESLLLDAKRKIFLKYRKLYCSLKNNSLGKYTIFYQGD